MVSIGKESGRLDGDEGLVVGGCPEKLTLNAKRHGQLEVPRLPGCVFDLIYSKTQHLHQPPTTVFQVSIHICCKTFQDTVTRNTRCSKVLHHDAPNDHPLISTAGWPVSSVLHQLATNGCW